MFIAVNCCVQIARNEKQWKQWYGKEALEDEVIPDGYNNSLDVFRRLILIRCWAPDRTDSQAHIYIADSLGNKYAEGVILDKEKVWDESNSRTPIVGLLSMAWLLTRNHVVQISHTHLTSHMRP